MNEGRTEAKLKGAFQPPLSQIFVAKVTASWSGPFLLFKLFFGQWQYNSFCCHRSYQIGSNVFIGNFN